MLAVELENRRKLPVGYLEVSLRRAELNAVADRQSARFAPCALFALALVWRVRHQIDAEHLRGLRLLRPSDHNRQLNGGWLRQRLNYEQRGIQLGASIIPSAKECENFLV